MMTSDLLSQDEIDALLNGDDRISWFEINSENFESIHNHNAYAQLTRDKR